MLLKRLSLRRRELASCAILTSADDLLGGGGVQGKPLQGKRGGIKAS
jgi:hypothetical protein